MIFKINATNFSAVKCSFRAGFFALLGGGNKQQSLSSDQLRWGWGCRGLNRTKGVGGSSAFPHSATTALGRKVPEVDS